MGEVAGDRNVPLVDRLATDGSQPREQVSIAIGPSVVLTARVQ